MAEREPILVTFAPRKPNARDLAQVGLVIRSFPGAYGSVNQRGEFRPSIGDPRMLVLFVPTSMQGMSEMWKRCGIAIDGQRSYPQMREAPEHALNVYFFKVKRGWFKSAWVGNIQFNFGDRHVDAGSISGQTQSAMWQQLRQFIDRSRRDND